jgi:hypothetical protein
MIAITTSQAAIHPLLANGQPAVSCFGMHIDEIVQRQNFAYERAKAKAQAEGADEQDAQDIASMTLWHGFFPDGICLYISDNDLFRVTADLPGELFAANGCRELDFYDYGYVADILRERLASCVLTQGDAQNLRRALAWVEQAGAALLPTVQAHLTAALPEAAPALAA